MAHHYRITVEPLGTDGAGDRLEFEVANHDDLLEIVDSVREKAVIPASEAAEFSIGLKLFADVLRRHRRDPLFEPLWPHFGDFMKRLKS
ncbi:DUF3861 domain-containing protein [Aureimonas altamirensis]|uniref:DUF3861 domain-containing protein n=1 Tax=Aureimonas altamirensis TaxID=370622 RepID=UPI001E29C8CC|nr:DUF3861 domain-containing protein [Aureimonas altamirensis]UHD45233.1 DUF3861 domain-containing protein [Aureimonas altamirensis]